MYSESSSSRSAQEKANLLRIRDNQRRSRARRKEYIQELETRVRQCELQGIEVSSEIQIAARQVSDENRKLRLLLNQSGIFDDMIEHHLATAVLPDNAGGSSAILLEGLLQPRKAVSLGEAASRELSLARPGENGRRSSSRDASVTSSFEHERHRSSYSEDPSSSSTTGNQTSSSIANIGVSRTESQNSSILVANPEQNAPTRYPPNPSSASPSSPNMNTSPMYDSRIFDFNIQGNAPYSSNNYYFQSVAPHGQLPSPNRLQPNLRPQSQAQTLSWANSQTLSSSNSNRSDQEPNFEPTLMNMSSCYYATDMIQNLSGGRGDVVRAELGYGDGEDCNVRDDGIFGIL